MVPFHTQTENSHNIVFVQLYLIIFVADPQPEHVGCTRANRYHNFTCSIHLCHRKQSSADLQSRLKSRKILGVGATDDGLDIHRSKVGYNYRTYVQWFRDHHNYVCCNDDVCN